MNIFLRRILGAMALDARTYEEVEADQRAGWQALAVVVLSSSAGALAARGLGAPRTELPTLVFLGILTWSGWSVLTYQVGRQLLRTNDTRSDVGELLRTLGFASAPGILAVAGIVPSISRIVVTVTTLWMLCAMIVAVRQALDYSSTVRAVAVCVVGLLLSILMMLLFGTMLSPVLLSQS